MLKLQKFKSLAETLRLPARVTIEEELFYDSVLPAIITWQEAPDIALQSMTGVFLPPHQRTTMYVGHLGCPFNYNVSSRGTSKSTTVCVFYANYKAAFFAKRKIVTLSAVGFRGAQVIMNDTEKWLNGGFDSQEQDLLFLKDSTTADNVVKRSQNVWSIDYRTMSSNLGLPTTDPDRIRGIRANDVFFDEANTGSEDLIERVVIPFLNVTGDFKHGGAYAQENALFFTTTIDYQWRPFQKRLRAAQEAIARDMHWMAAKRAGDWERVRELEKLGVLRSTFVGFDYTDTYIREELTTRSGRRFRVRFPNDDLVLRTFDEGLPFTERDPETGRMLKFGNPVTAWPTYPLQKDQIEQGLMEGSTDEAVWLSEQRNIVDTSTGEVYSHILVDEASCEGDREALPWGKCGEEWKARYPDERGWIPPIQWSNSDPCVVGVDYAPGGGDFCAFVVIRLGPCAEGPFNPFAGTGRTNFSNVLWCEQHRRMSHKDVGDKLREYKDRYNLSYHHDPYVIDTWQLCRAIGLDMRGGGSGVRDDLVHINREVISAYEYRIYDPLDHDDRVLGFATQERTIPMLDAIQPTDQLNDRLVEWTVGSMQQGTLYLPKYLDRSERPGDRRLDLAYEASRSLSLQLRKLQQEPTKNHRKFYMEGNTTAIENKKDLWSAFIYAAKQHRAHIIRQRNLDNTPPPMGATVTRVNAHRGRRSGRVPGSIGW
jgi:hypothetical protein